MRLRVSKYLRPSTLNACPAVFLNLLAALLTASLAAPLAAREVASGPSGASAARAVRAGTPARQTRQAPPARAQEAAPARDRPPREEGEFRRPDLVELSRLDRTIRLDIRYATARNFVGRPVYREARAFLQRPAAEALVRVNRSLRKRGYGLVVFDGYRPWRVTKLFWDLTPEGKKEFVADPARGSRHNRGCAVDLTLYDLKTGRQVEMLSAYDDFTERAHVNYAGGTEQQRRLRDLLRAAMEAEGFSPYEPEWWHYDYRDWRAYPILDLDFSEVPGVKGRGEQAPRR